MISFALVLSICSIVLTMITSIFSILSYCKVVGLEKSTHQISWVPLNEGVSEVNRDKELSNALYPDIEKEYV